MNKLILLVSIFCTLNTFAQPIKEGNRLTELRKHIEFLANDKLEGRRSGTKGEKLAYKYIIKQFASGGIEPLNDYPDYLQPFPINDGRKIESARVLINKVELADSMFFPLSWSGNGNQKLLPGESRVVDLSLILKENSNNPHFDFLPFIYDSVKSLSQRGAKAVVLVNTSSVSDDIHFDSNSKFPALSIPVIYITKAGWQNSTILKQPSALKIKIELKESGRTGHNVVGFINNHSATTVILGAHYDHLGYGEDHNSLYAGPVPMIHNGADDNASGTAALLLLGRMLKNSQLKNNNYILIAFSGEELGLFGSKYFTEHDAMKLSTVNYMINMDMVGRLNDSTQGLTIGGYGTSPLWGNLTPLKQNSFSIKFDSSGIGPSDHTSFYRKNIPVLFFFTGSHHDYHKPSDDAYKINYTGELRVIDLIYNIIGEADNSGKIQFTKTKETVSSGKTSLKVTLGIMPDYTFSGNGVRVDGVSEGRPAQKAGIEVGDILFKLGDFSFEDVQTYMQVLNKFEKGIATRVSLKRGEKELVLDIIL